MNIGPVISCQRGHLARFELGRERQGGEGREDRARVGRRLGQQTKGGVWGMVREGARIREGGMAGEGARRCEGWMVRVGSMWCGERVVGEMAVMWIVAIITWV